MQNRIREVHDVQHCTTEPAEIALKARPKGDILRTVRSLHPQGGRLNRMVDAEAAVSESARILENASREHRKNLVRLNVLRERDNHPLVPVPSTEALTTVSADGIIGWVVERDRLTDLNKTAGKLLLLSGDIVSWTAAASYVDALEVLFDGAPVQVTGPFQDNGSISIQGVRPAPREHWRSDEEYEAACGLGGMTVLAASLVKRDLAKQNGSACQVCGRSFSKLTQASIADMVNGAPALVCRPCKEDWKTSQLGGAA